MWQIKRFKTFDEQKAWIKHNSYRYQIHLLFVNNGYAVEYKKLRIIDFPD